MEQRKRDARKGGQESENVVRDCKAPAEEEVWSGWYQVEKQIQINQWDRKKPKRKIEREEWEVRQFLRTVKPFWRGSLWTLMKKIKRVRLELVQTVELREEHCWTALIEGSEEFQLSKRNNKEEPGEGDCERKRSWEEACDVETFLLARSQTSQTRPVLVFLC